MKRFILSLFTGSVILFVAAQVWSQSPQTEAADPVVQPPPVEAMLQSILDIKKNLNLRMAEKKKLKQHSLSETEKQRLDRELAQLDTQLADANADFQRVATGVDMGLFIQVEEPPFDWQKELISLAEPGIMELKRVTQKARKKARLKDDINRYGQLLPVARTAVENIRKLALSTGDPSLKQSLNALVPEWESLAGQLENRLKFLELELDRMAAEEASLIESSKISVKRFFKTRGLFIFIAVVTCTLIILVLRLAYGMLARWVPGHGSRYRPFHIRVMELVFRVLTAMAALLALVLVFYFFEDWVLLSLTIIFILGLGWTAKTTLPRFLQQSRLMLNIGAVREGERIWYQGVPWRVARIHMFSTLENPDLGQSLRVPIETLMDLSSRPSQPHERYFPCRLNDWVILADDTRGCVVSLSHETVDLVLRGGARKTYLTGDFLSQSPLNLSTNFRLKEAFGIGYQHQDAAVGQVPEILEAHLRKRLEEEGHGAELLNLRVEFARANDSSLDLMVIADFKGELAHLYNRLRRAIQRWCVEACTQNDWEIPYPQMVVHRSREN